MRLAGGGQALEAAAVEDVAVAFLVVQVLRECVGGGEVETVREALGHLRLERVVPGLPSGAQMEPMPAYCGKGRRLCITVPVSGKLA